MKSIPAVHFRFGGLVGTLFGMTTIGVAHRPSPRSLALLWIATDMATTRAE
jgi:hypothetical protein